MPVAQLLIDRVARHEILSFMNGHSKYNYIYTTKKNVLKTTFKCLGALGIYAWVVMYFGLKNASATY